MQVRTQARRLAVAILVAIGVLISTATPSAAAYWRVEEDWYKTKATCTSRAGSLMGTGLYLDFNCRLNTYRHPDNTVRWTLRLLVPQAGDPRAVAL
jgi:hypothetical protein